MTETSPRPTLTPPPRPHLPPQLATKINASLEAAGSPAPDQLVTKIRSAVSNKDEGVDQIEAYKVGNRTLYANVKNKTEAKCLVEYTRGRLQYEADLKQGEFTAVKAVCDSFHDWHHLRFRSPPPPPSPLPVLTVRVCVSLCTTFLPHLPSNLPLSLPQVPPLPLSPRCPRLPTKTLSASTTPNSATLSTWCRAPQAPARRAAPR